MLLENNAREFHFGISEWNNGREARGGVALTNLGWIEFAGDLLALELDIAGFAHCLSLFPALAGIHPGRGRPH